jgi:hypothetical protein
MHGHRKDHLRRSDPAHQWRPTGPLSASTGQYFLYAIDVPAGAGNLSITTGGGTGDADIYVRYGALPTLAIADCMSPGRDDGGDLQLRDAIRWPVLHPAAGLHDHRQRGADGQLQRRRRRRMRRADAVHIDRRCHGDRRRRRHKAVSFPGDPVVARAGHGDVQRRDAAGQREPVDDYVEVGAQGTIAACATSATVNVTIIGDTRVEQNETFVVELSNLSNANVGDLQAQGRINNDDQAQLRIADVTTVEGQQRQAVGVFEITLSQPSRAP